MFLPMIIAGTISLLFIDQVFKKPEKKSKEKDFIKAFNEYVKEIQDQKDGGDNKG